MKIVIQGNPIPKARARFRRLGQRTMTYDPQDKSKKQIAQVMTTTLQHALNSENELWRNEAALIHSGSPIMVKARFYLPFQKVWRQSDLKEKEWGFVNHTSKPDCSNLIKFYEDCMNKTIFKDDSQIVVLMCDKQYSSNPRTEIEIKVMPENTISPKAKQILKIFHPDELKQLLNDAYSLSSELPDVADISDLSADCLMTLAEKLSDFAQEYNAKLKKIPTYKRAIDDFAWQEN